MVSMSRWAQRESEQKRALEESQEQLRREQELRRTLEESVDRERVRKKSINGCRRTRYTQMSQGTNRCYREARQALR